MSDLISRQALHEKINETVNEGLIFSGMTIAEFIEALIDAEPSAERTGHWIDGEDVPNRNPHLHISGIKFCSECLNEAYWDTDYGQQLFDFCPNCGARMVSEE